MIHQTKSNKNNRYWEVSVAIKITDIRKQHQLEWS